jgi:hypothetical protein
VYNGDKKEALHLILMDGPNIKLPIDKMYLQQ